MLRYRPSAPSELNPEYAKAPEMPDEFRELVAKVREDQQATGAAQKFFRRRAITGPDFIFELISKKEGVSSRW